MGSFIKKIQSKKSLCPDLDNATQGQWCHLMFPSKSQNFCLKHFPLKYIVQEKFEVII